MKEKYILSIDEGTTSTRAIIFDHDGKEIARGLVNYDAHDLLLIKGHSTADIAKVLQINATHDEVIHRNNLVIIH